MNALETLLFWVRTNNHPVYEKYVIDAYEEEHGAHFDENLARDVVSKMHSKMGSGEHWTIDQVKTATNGFSENGETCWDRYVALHVFYHDLGEEYRRLGIAEPHLINNAMVFFFMDEDAPDGKIWKYCMSMR